MTLSQADFTFVSNLVRREAAIVLAPGKESLVEARLIPVARLVGAADVATFLADLQRRPRLYRRGAEPGGDQRAVGRRGRHRRACVRDDAGPAQRQCA